ncbi:MAG: carbon-nitrogen hydrolase family protein [Myxococcota bacterium]
MDDALRVAVVQLTSTDVLSDNLAVAEGLVREAAAAGARFIALPEMFPFLRREGQTFPHAQDVEGEILGHVRDWARFHQVRIAAGSIAEVTDSERVYNTSVLVGPDGATEAVYRKIHLFDVDLGDAGGGTYQESKSIAPGDEVVVADTEIGGIGLSVCYDLRFPELYRTQAARGAQWLLVPSAFAPATGRDHWEVLLRARAIENQAFVLAAAQCGQHSPDRASYGRSLIVDPWGVILAQLADAPGIAVADCSRAHLARVRQKLPALAHRRL